MCGIAGFTLSAMDAGRLGGDGATDLARALVLEIQSRGSDATGIANLLHNGHIHLAKAPVPARKFVNDDAFNVGVEAMATIMHTRFGTQGSESNPLNNHPIHWGSVVGVHNGCIQSDYDFFKKYGGRKAEVDSEAIFAGLSLLDRYTALPDVEGTMAIAWFDVRTPTILHLAKGASSPLLTARTKGGSWIFGSTRATLTKADKLLDLDYGSIVERQSGTIIEIDVLTMDATFSQFVPDNGLSGYDWTHYRDSKKAGSTTTVVRTSTPVDNSPYRKPEEGRPFVVPAVTAGTDGANTSGANDGTDSATVADWAAQQIAPYDDMADDAWEWDRDAPRWAGDYVMHRGTGKRGIITNTLESGNAVVRWDDEIVAMDDLRLLDA